MKQPELEARHGIVIAGVTHVQKAKDVFIEEVEPEEAVVFARDATQSEVEVGRIGEGGGEVPRDGNREEDQEALEDAEAAPGVGGKNLVGEDEIEECSCTWEEQSDEAL